MRAHLDAAMTARPHNFFLDRAITPKIKNLTMKLKERPDEVVRERAEMLQHLQDLSNKLEPTRNKWRKAPPRDSPSRDINFPLLHLILTSLEYNDKSMTGDVSRGLPIAGPVPITNALKAKRKASTLTVEDWLSNIEKRNTSIAKRISEPRKFELSVH